MSSVDGDDHSRQRACDDQARLNEQLGLGEGTPSYCGTGADSSPPGEPSIVREECSHCQFNLRIGTAERHDHQIITGQMTSSDGRGSMLKPVSP